MNSVYTINCNDCPASYTGQTYRPILTRIKEHEASYRLDKSTDRFGNIKSAPALHAHSTGHTINWNGTYILGTVKTRQQLDFAEHIAIKHFNPSMNRTLVGPNINPIWNNIAPKACTSFKKKPSNISKFWIL